MTLLIQSFFDNYYGNNNDGFFGWYGNSSNNGWADMTGGNGSYRMNAGEIAHISTTAF